MDADHIHSIPSHIPGFRNAVECARDIYITDGLRGFYRGISASYAGVCSLLSVTIIFLGTLETALQLMLYERLKAALADSEPSTQSRASITFLNRAHSARVLRIFCGCKPVQDHRLHVRLPPRCRICAPSINLPRAEVVRTRLREKTSGARKYTGFFQSLKAFPGPRA